MLLIATALAAEPLSVRRAEVNLADAVYVDEFLREPQRAAQLYQVVLSEASATRAERHTAGWRLGRAYRRLNRPADARAQLGGLLIDPELPEDLRVIVERELRLLPRSHPALLMADDCLVYLEIPQPGIFLERCVGLARRAGLERAFINAGTWRLQPLGNFALFGSLDISPFLNPAWRTELSKLDALGIAWRDFHFEPVDQQINAVSELVCALHTGGNQPAAEALESVLQRWISPLTATSQNNLIVPSGLNPQLKLASSDGLLVLSSSDEAAQATITRYQECDTANTLAGTAAYQRHPTDWPSPDSMFVYLDWPPLLKQLISSLPPDNARPLQATAQLLGLQTLGPIFGMLRLGNNELTIDLTLELNDSSHPLSQALRTPPLPLDWSQWVPDDAWFAFVTSLSPGDERWQAFKAFTADLDAYWGLDAPQDDDATPVRSSFIATWKDFETRTGVSIADDLCRDVQTLTVVAQPVHAEQGWTAPWVFVLEVNQPERWLRQAETALGRWLFTDLPTTDLPTSQVTTPVGIVTRLPVPWTAGLAWQVRGRRVVFAFGVESLVRYLQAVPSAGGIDHAPDGRRPCKYYRGQVDASLIDALYPIPKSRDETPVSDIPSFELWTHEDEQRVHVTFRQRRPHLAIRQLASERFGITPQPPTTADALLNK